MKDMLLCLLISTVPALLNNNNNKKKVLTLALKWRLKYLPPILKCPGVSPSCAPGSRVLLSILCLLPILLFDTAGQKAHNDRSAGQCFGVSAGSVCPLLAYGTPRAEVLTALARTCLPLGLARFLAAKYLLEMWEMGGIGRYVPVFASSRAISSVCLM